MEGLSKRVIRIVSLWILLNFNSCNSNTNTDMFNLKVVNRDVISTEYSKEFHNGLPLSCNYIAIFPNITQILRTAPDTGRNFIYPQDRIIFIKVENEPQFYDVMTSINVYSQPVSKWKPTYILQILLAEKHTAVSISQQLALSPHKYSWIDLASRVFLQFGENELYEIYFVKTSLFLKCVSDNFSLSPFGLEFGESDLSRRKDFQSVLINGVTQDDKDLDLIATFENATIPKFVNGLSVSYFQLMAFGLNFSVGAVRGTGWIRRAEDGSLLGMAQQLLSGEADILIAHSELLPYRLRGLKYLHPYYRGKVRAFFKQPGLSKIRNIFFTPLQPYVWICLFLLWLLLVACLRGTFTLKRKLFGSPFNKIGRKSSDLNLLGEDPSTSQDEEDLGIRDMFQKDKSLASDALLWAVSTACGQGWHLLPHSGSMKLIVLSGLTTYIFSYTAYSAAIVTSLSILLVPIKNWADLSGWSGYTLYGDVLLQYSEQLANNNSSKSWDKRSSSNKRLMNVTDALVRFQRNEPIALISVFDQFYQIAGKANYSHKFLCSSVAKVSVDGHVVKGGMIVRQDSPFNKYFNFITIMIQERGLDARLSRHYSNKWSPGCLEQGKQRHDKYILEINDVFTAFAILLAGFCASGALVVVERGSALNRSRHYCKPFVEGNNHTPTQPIWLWWKWGFRMCKRLTERGKKNKQMLAPQKSL